MSHLTEQEVMLCYFGEPESPAHTQHLTTCESCSTELNRLRALLDRVTAADPPEPAAGYEQVVWERLRWKLPPHRRRAAAWMKWTALAAAIALAFITGLLWQRGSVTPEDILVTQAPAGAVTAEQRDRILLVVIADHFDRSERVLVELVNLESHGESNNEFDISAKQGRAEALLESNRLYRRTATERGEDRMATLLDDLEPVLLQIARSPSQLTSEELQSIQKRVESRELLFKLRVVRAGVTESTTTPPPTI